MSSAVFSTSAAQSRPFVLDSQDEAGVCPQLCPQPSAAELFGEARPPQRVVPPRGAFPAGAFKDGAFKDARLAGITPVTPFHGRYRPIVLIHFAIDGRSDEVHLHTGEGNVDSMKLFRNKGLVEHHAPIGIA